MKKLFSLVLFAAVAAIASATPPVPKVTVSAPSQVLIGEDFTFTVTFETDPPSTTPPTVGFAPFITLVLDKGGADHNTASGPCDGITLVSADLVGVNGGPFTVAPITVNAPCGSPASLPHPFGTSPFGPVNVPASAEMTVLALPFGSVVSTQPKFTISVKAHVHNFADVGHPLFIYASGGFRYGNDPLNNQAPDPPILTDTNNTASAWTAQTTVTPAVFIVSKKCLSPEGETATGPNFPRQCEITVDVAKGQTITDLIITDCVSGNMQYVSLNSAGTTPGYAILATPPPCLKLKYPSVTGVAGPDIKVNFNFYVPLNDATGPVLDSNSCQNAISTDDAKAESDWLPLDPRDQPSQHITSPNAQCSITDKRLTIRKSVAVMPVPIGPLRPGKILRYTLDVEISDYFTMGNISLNDFLGDGQDFLTTGTYLPKLTVRDRRQPSINVPLVIGQTVTYASNPFSYCKGVKGGTTVMFKVSLAMQSNSGLFTSPVVQAGILTGGYAFTPASTVPATARIIFYTKVRDTFIHPQGPGDQFLDKDDPINNCVDGGGQVYTNDPNMPQPVKTGPMGLLLSCGDDSSSTIVLPGDTLRKTVFAVKRGNYTVCGPGGAACSNLPNPPQEVRPGDTVTFELKKTIPSSDAENLTVTDWLPLPVFDVNPAWVFTNAINATQIPGTAHLGSSDTLHTVVGAAIPTFFPSQPTNSIKFNYGSFNATNNQPGTIDLIFSAGITNQPYADGLNLTNEAQECETNTFGEWFCQTAIAPIKVREPNLVIRKGVVATNNPNGVFSPALVPAGKWKPFAPGVVCPRFNGTINTNLPGLISSNLSNVDANDWVTFAIAIENTGGATAYDIELDDIIPCDPLDRPSCFAPDYSTMCVYGGNGLPIAATNTPGGHCRRKIKLTPGLPPANAINSSTGANIAIITFNAQLNSDIQPGCCDNRTDLLHYSSQPGGPDFVGAGFSPPFSDNATVCVNPTLTKSIVATSEAHTTGSNLTIGEIARYRLLVVLPEGGVLQNFQVIDALPPGLKFLNDNSARIAFVSNATGITRTTLLPSPYSATTLPSSATLHSMLPIPAGVISSIPLNCGDPVVFDLGDVQNQDSDNDLEYIVIEFNALVCNVPGNQNSTALPNAFNVSVAGNPIATSNTVSVTVVEPKLTISKTASPTTIAQGGTITYSVTINNPGPLPAYDVQFTDTLPAGLSFLANSTTTTGGCSSTSSTSPAVTCTSVPIGTVTITYKATANPSTCPANLTNQAKVTWTSLPGPKGTTTNSTWSTTPGGTDDGERDGTTPSLTLNDYVALTSATVAVTCPSCAQPPPGMVAWWPLDEQNGATVVNDIALFNNQGTPNPGPLGSANAPNGIVGKVAGALHFSTSPLNYVEVSNQPEINFGIGNLSIDVWINPATVVAPNRIQPIVDKVQGNVGYSLYIESQQLHFSIGGSSFVTYVGTPTIPPNVWTHIAVTIAHPNTVILYINGAQVPWQMGPSLPSGSTDNPAPLWIGGSRLGLSRDEITLDEIEFFNRPLTLSEVQKIFSADSAGKCKCLAISNDVVKCNGDGTFSYTFTVTNISGSPINGFSLSSGSTSVAVTPGFMSVPLLTPGNSTSVTVTIGGPGAVSSASLCIYVGSVGPPPTMDCSSSHCLTLPPCQTACAPQPPNMVSWWPLDEQNGATVVADIKGGYNGTPTVNGVPGTIANAQPGEVHGSINVWVNNTINVPSTPSLALGTSNLSIDAWVLSGQPLFIVAVADTLDTGANKGYALYVENQLLKFVIGNGSALTTYASSSQVASNMVWHHIAVTVDRSTKAGIFYIDGNPAGNFTLAINSTVNIGSSSPLLVGGSRLIFSGNPTPCVCEFNLDEVEIFNGVVSLADIRAIFTAGSAGKCH